MTPSSVWKSQIDGANSDIGKMKPAAARSPHPASSHESRQRLERDFLQTDNAGNFLDEVGLALNIRPPARSLAREAADRLGDFEAERSEDALLLGDGNVDAAQGFHPPLAQRITTLPLGSLAGDHKI